MGVTVIVAPVPANVGLLTVPAGVYDAVAVPAVPVNVAFNSAPVPVNVGAEAVAVLILVATVTAVPALGNVPAETEPADHPRVNVSPLTVALIEGRVQEGKVPALPKGFTEAVFISTDTVGLLTVPLGV